MKKHLTFIILALTGVTGILFYALFTDSGKRFVMQKRIMWKYRSKWTKDMKDKVKFELQTRTLLELKEFYVNGEIEAP